MSIAEGSVKHLDETGRREPRPPEKVQSPEACPICAVLTGGSVHYKIAESVFWYAFLDNHPLSDGHVVVVSKSHHRHLSQLPREQMWELGPFVHALSGVFESEDWNLLHNNGRLAHQFSDHVSFHVIPKTSSKEGLLLRWLVEPKNQGELLKSSTRLIHHLTASLT